MQSTLRLEGESLVWNHLLGETNCARLRCVTAVKLCGLLLLVNDCECKFIPDLHSLWWKVFAVPCRRCKNCLDLIDWIVFYPWMVATIDENFNYIIYGCHRWNEVEFISCKLLFVWRVPFSSITSRPFMHAIVCGANDSSPIGRESLAFIETNDQTSSLKGVVTSLLSRFASPIANGACKLGCGP